MKKLIAACAIALLSGCASKEKVAYTAPSIVGVKTSIEKLKPHITNSAGNAAINGVISAIDTYESQVNQQSKDLAKAQNDAVYWRGKHVKGLKELWTCRLIALFGILCVVVYAGIKTARQQILGNVSHAKEEVFENLTSNAKEDSYES